MDQVKDQALQKYAKIINGADGTKSAIIRTAEFEEKCKIAIEEQSKQQEEEKQEETFKFDPRDFDENAEVLSMRENSKKESFRERLEVSEEDFIPYEKPTDITNEEKDKDENKEIAD